MASVVSALWSTLLLLLMSCSVEEALKACQNIYVLGTKHCTERLYTLQTATCESRPVYRHTWRWDHHYLYSYKGQWGLSDRELNCSRKPVELGPVTDRPYNVDWYDMITITCMDGGVRQLKPSLVSFDDSTVRSLMDWEPDTCITLARSGIQPGSEYKLEFDVNMLGISHLRVQGYNVTCSASSVSVGYNMVLAKIPEANHRTTCSCSQCNVNVYKKYVFQSAYRYEDGYRICKFSVSCEEPGGCTGVVLTLRYQDFLAPEIQLCAVIPYHTDWL